MDDDGGSRENNTALASEYTNVIFKRVIGNLTISPSNLLFRPRPQNGTDSSSVAIEWKDALKHQVSPVNHPKPLLKVLLIPNSNNNNPTNVATTGKSKSKSDSSVTFQMDDRDDLERIRKEISVRLQSYAAATSQHDTSSNSRKRAHAEMQPDSKTSFGELDPAAIAVTRSALLAANAALRQQHKYLVTETNTISEDDFWATHQHLLEDEYARISGIAKAGTSSVLQSHLPNSGRVTLGVQEMRQIFILYPAVHKAYEEKVPLELSDEQFWRKYLESEYFHRDRGRIGTANRNHAPPEAKQQLMDDSKKKNSASSGPTFEQQEARAAAVGTDDLFSRYDQKIQEESGAVDPQQAGSLVSGVGDSSQQRWGTHLAVGQFDLASTFETERGYLLEGPKDNFPANHNDDGKGSRVIQKYNRHWAMVLHPDLAVAGSNLTEVARRSVYDVLPNDDEANVQGGVDVEMRRLVDYADATEEETNHAAGVGLQDGGNLEPLTLQNVEAYYSGRANTATNTLESNEEASKKHAILSRSVAVKTQSLIKDAYPTTDSKNLYLSDTCFPATALGRELLMALTKKMAKDSETEAQSLEMVNKLPDDFRNRLQIDFRRSSELLRHFFGLRRIEAECGDDDGVTNQKLARIVRGMETFYREMEGMRKDLPQTETGEMMRKMCLPIMDQLDWAFKLNREGSGSGGGGGFVTVDEL